jgi:hypothetical protein
MRAGRLVAWIMTATAALLACDSRPQPSASLVSLGAGWTHRVAAPIALTEVAATVAAGRIWVAGGLDVAGRATDAVSVFQPARDTWVAGPDLPEPVHHAALVSDGEGIWLIGGYVGGGFDRPTASVWTLQGDNWTEHVPLPEARAAGAAAWDGAGRIVYAGGAGPGGASRTVWARAEQGWEEYGQLPEPLDHLAATSDGAGTVFVLGGRRGGLDSNRATVTTVQSDGTRHLGDLPTPRGGVAAFWWPSLGACLVGGESPGGTNPQVECIDAGGALRALPDLTEARHGLGAAVVDGVVYILLGGDRPGLTVTGVVESLELP